MSAEKAYSTDSNMLGATHEAKDLEHLEDVYKRQGGGGLIALPAYLIAGVPAHLALGTNKLSSAMGTVVSAFRLWRAGVKGSSSGPSCKISSPPLHEYTMKKIKVSPIYFNISFIFSYFLF